MADEHYTTIAYKQLLQIRIETKKFTLHFQELGNVYPEIHLYQFINAISHATSADMVGDILKQTYSNFLTVTFPFSTAFKHLTSPGLASFLSAIYLTQLDTRLDKLDPVDPRDPQFTAFLTKLQTHATHHPLLNDYITKVLYSITHDVSTDLPDISFELSTLNALLNNSFTTGFISDTNVT